MSTWSVSVCGTALTDHLYANIDFSSEAMAQFLSKIDGDGGFAPGKLVFAEDLERFAGKPYPEIIGEITANRSPIAINLGGPAIVGAINAAQILSGENCHFSFYGVRSDDASGKVIESIIVKTPLDCSHYRVIPGEFTSCTDVLSDPSANNGKGERSFLFQLGCGIHMNPSDLDDSFFRSQVTWYSATALVPGLHDSLTSLLKKSKDCGCVNVVSTVFDFRNEKRDPVGPWPLGESRDSYKYIDLLIVDKEEALRLSGKNNIEEASAFFRENGVSAFFITYGAKNFFAWSDGRLFKQTGNEPVQLPVSALADADLAEHPEKRGDTTGCGDNFAGGIVASMVRQLSAGCHPGEVSLLDAAAWGAASGGAALFHLGGTYVEKRQGEKQEILKRYADAYLQDPEVIRKNIR